MGEGWIKLHRALIDKPIWVNSTPEQKVILITLLTMVNHRDREFDINGTKILIQQGQCITSLEKICEQSGKGISIQNTRTALKRFEKMEFLTSKSTNKFRLITIVNWELYQGIIDEPNKQINENLTSNQQAPNKHLTSNQQAPNKHLTTNNNVKNVKNVENEKNGENERIKTLLAETFGEGSALLETFTEYVQYRKSIKKPMTELAVKKSIKKLQTLANNDVESVEILEQSICNGWSGLFELKNKTGYIQRQPQAQQQPQNETQAAFDKMIEEMANNAGR